MLLFHIRVVGARVECSLNSFVVLSQALIKFFFPKYVCISWPLFDFLGFAGYTFKVIVYAEFTKVVEGI